MNEQTTTEPALSKAELMALRATIEGYEEPGSYRDMLLRLLNTAEAQAAELDRLWSEATWREIQHERARQDQKWGGPGHDDQHTDHDWIVYLTKHLGKAVVWPFAPYRFRYQMIRVAALAVAAVEWVDRNFLAKKHEVSDAEVPAPSAQ